MREIICPFCRRPTQVAEGDNLPRFCFHCRKLLPGKYCPKCSFGEFLDEANFCTKCGEKLEATTV